MSESMRVLLVNHFPLIGSGSGTYTGNIAAYLMKKGHETAIVLPENTSKPEQLQGAAIYPVFFTYDENIENALPFNFPCFTTHPRSVMTFAQLDDSQLKAYLDAFEKEIRKAVTEFKPDLIHCQHIWLLTWLAGKTDVPYVVTAHGTDLMGYQQSSRFRKYADEAAKGANKIITISHDNNELVREMFPDYASKSVFMRNGYDPERFYPEPKTKAQIGEIFDIKVSEKLVVFAGKLAYFKGIDVLLEAAKLYEGERPKQITTIIAGDGELSESLKNQAKKLSLQGVHFVGHIDSAQLRSLFSSADISVVPSRREPFGLVAIEALACGCPVIATNQGGLPDIINDSIGALVCVDDAFGLSAAIIKEMYRPDRRQRGISAAKYALENYTQDSLIDTLVEIYECKPQNHAKTAADEF